MTPNVEVKKLVIKVPKEESAFVYFTLEANEGIASHSTLPFNEGDPYRLIAMFSPIDFFPELQRIIHELGKKFEVVIVEQPVCDPETSKDELFANKKTIYGPVQSWRFGKSLGVDPIFETSTCSFDCIYCQLGKITKKTDEYREYVPTAQVIRDYKDFLQTQIPFDVITYSGSGEPTLAKNLGEIICEIRKLSPDKGQIILTNSTVMSRPEVIKTLLLLDHVTVKLDAVTDGNLKLINRPVGAININQIIHSLIEFRKIFKGKLEIQTMFANFNQDKNEIEKFAEVYNKINPDTIFINTPTRPYPMSWHRENRGNHLKIFDHEVRELKPLSKEELTIIENKIRKLTKAEVISTYTNR